MKRFFKRLFCLHVWAYGRMTFDKHRYCSKCDTLQTQNGRKWKVWE